MDLTDFVSGQPSDQDDREKAKNHGEGVFGNDFLLLLCFRLANRARPTTAGCMGLEHNAKGPANQYSTFQANARVVHGADACAHRRDVAS